MTRNDENIYFKKEYVGSVPQDSGHHVGDKTVLKAQLLFLAFIASPIVIVAAIHLLFKL